MKVVCATSRHPYGDGFIVSVRPENSVEHAICVEFGFPINNGCVPPLCEYRPAPDLSSLQARFNPIEEA